MAAQRVAPQDDYGQSLIIERPDGYYWLSPDEGREYGPFANLEEAAMDMDLVDAEALESLQEAEDEIGISDWIDPDTGLPAEDSIPHLGDM